MNLDLLRADLADLAEDVIPVDLRDRTLTTSHRLGRRRTAVRTAAALAVLAAAGVGFAVLPDRGVTLLPPAVTPSVTTGPTLRGGIQTDPTADPTMDPTAERGADGTATAKPGRLFYGPDPSVGGSSAHIISWTGSGNPRELIQLPHVAAIANATVSPDGNLVAWVDSTARLLVANLDGSGQRQLLNRVDGQCWGPVFSSDSRHIGAAQVRPGGSADYRDVKGVYDLQANRFVEVGDEWRVNGCHPVWSDDSSVVAFADAMTGQVMITNRFLQAPTPVPNLGAGAQRFSFDVASIARDGSKVAIKVRERGEPAGDVGRELDANAVIDVVTGAEVRLPLDGRRMEQAMFRPDGALVVRVADGDRRALVLIGPDLRKVTEIAEPDSLAAMQLLRVAV
ncbi:MAG TPA: hypothetical protein VI011_06230 [Asanoa sp.]